MLLLKELYCDMFQLFLKLHSTVIHIKEEEKQYIHAYFGVAWVYWSYCIFLQFLNRVVDNPQLFFSKIKTNNLRLNYLSKRTHDIKSWVGSILNHLLFQVHPNFCFSKRVAPVFGGQLWHARYVHWINKFSCAVWNSQHVMISLSS